MNQAQEIIARQPQTTRIQCPFCNHLRKPVHQKQKTCAVEVFPDRTVFQCHHCGENGMIPREDEFRRFLRNEPPPKPVVHIPTSLTQDDQVVIDYFKTRGVELSDLSGLPPLVTAPRYFHDVQSELPAIGFVYGERQAPTAIKWRPLDRKAFTQTGAARTFYGIDQLPESPKEVIIVEGEADVIALASVGVKAVSVPNGAPKKISKDGKIRPEEDKKFGYIWEAREILDGAKRIILATDQDEQGEALAEEIARRVGRAKCWRTKFPDNCKDMTDLLREHGSQAVADAINKAEAMPLEGVYGVGEYMPEVLDLYHNGLGKGESTGYESVDKLITIKGGMLTVVTGIPSSGKSEFIDQVMINLATQHDWKFAICSFENPPSMHIAKLSQKIIGKPFYKGPNPRMHEQELVQARDFIDEHFVFLESRSGELETIDSIIERTRQAVMRLGIRGLVIDPYNYIQRERNTNETQFISDMLTRVVAFCKSADVHVFFVAHPAKMYRREDGSYPVPKGMDISGSMAWYAKPDFGITVHRTDEAVEIHCWKVRFGWMGSMGMCCLDYDVPTGRYIERKEPFANFAVTANKIRDGLPKRHWLDDVK